MPAHASSQPPSRRRFWHVGVATLAALVPAAVAVGLNGSLDQPATAGEPADRIFATVSYGGLAFPIKPTPMCEFLNNFGERRGSRRHQGTDIGATEGQEVYAVTDGVLYEKDEVDDGGAGLAWRLLGDDGVKYLYFHLSDFAADLEEGDRVTRGQLIGYVGDTGNATPGGWHLHFEVRVPPKDTPVDPATLLAIPSVCRIYGTLPTTSTSTSTTSTSTTTSTTTSATTSTTSTTTPVPR